MIPLVKHYPVNRVGRTFVAGDLHGCYNQLMQLLAFVGFDFLNDILYQTGDIGNRGPQSMLCYQLLLEKWFRAVQGNHDAELVRAANDFTYDWGPILRHGGGWAHDLDRMTLRMLADRIKRLPFAIVVGEGAERFNVFHAEWHSDDAALDALNEKRQPPVWLVGGRDLFKGKVPAKYHLGLSPSFVGHNVVKTPRMIGSHVLIDTGSWHGEDPTDSRGISIIEPATQHVWQYTQGKVVQTA